MRVVWLGVARVRDAWAVRAAGREARRGERGATVLEWALIAAVVVVAASVIGGVVFNIVTDKSSELENCANQPAGSTCSP